MYNPKQNFISFLNTAMIYNSINMFREAHKLWNCQVNLEEDGLSLEIMCTSGNNNGLKIRARIRLNTAFPYEILSIKAIYIQTGRPVHIHPLFNEQGYYQLGGSDIYQTIELLLSHLVHSPLERVVTTRTCSTIAKIEEQNRKYGHLRMVPLKSGSDFGMSQSKNWGY